MKIKETDIDGLKVISPAVHGDHRGYFFESYNEKEFKKIGVEIQFVQDNQSRSDYGVVRGLHMQTGEHAQTKLIRVLEGSIFDVAVDLRKDSSTFGKWFGIELSDQNNLQLLIPKGFCHGFSVLSKIATVFYKCDNFYNKDSEAGIRHDDPSLAIDWMIPEEQIKISEKDANLPYFNNLIQ